MTGNSAGSQGGGAFGGTLRNCIAYFNEAPGGANWQSATYTYSCTTPLPPGEGNIAADPLLASATHLSLASPCLGAGNRLYTSGTDIDGEPWAVPPSMGADQVWLGQCLGALTVRMDASPRTAVQPGSPVRFTAEITGPTLANVWDFADGTVISNQVFTSNTWSTPGMYEARLTAYNDSHPEGVTATLTFDVQREWTYYVNAANATPVFPYTSWATAATNIQDAVSAGTIRGRVVLVTNGVYQTGTAEANGPSRVALTNMVLRSVNGPDGTIIDGLGAARCAYLGTNTILSGFTLRNGSGGGVLVEPGGLVTNCLVSGNSGYGASGGVLRNCVLTGNGGDGANQSTLYHGTVTGNPGLGVGWGSAFNSIVYFNQGNNWLETAFENSCTTPLPPSPGNIETDPRFVNFEGGDFRLRPDSPCIDAGTNLTELITTVLLGLPRPLDGDGDGVARFDMGAYEFDPSTLRFAPSLRLEPDGFHFTVRGEPGKTVRIERSRDLQSWEAVTTVPLPATGQALLDPAALSEAMLFYRAVAGP